jgi:hypothetical protein
MLLAIAAQGRGHGFERRAFAGFAGPLDAVFTLLREQLITFPGYVLSGRFARAWREAARSAGTMRAAAGPRRRS